MLQQCHSLNRFLQEWGCSCRHRCQQEHSRRLLSTATWTLPSRLDMRSFSCLTIRALDGALLFSVSDIFHCYSGGCSQSLVRDTRCLSSVCSNGQSDQRCGHLSLLNVAVGGGRRFLR